MSQQARADRVDIRAVLLLIAVLLGVLTVPLAGGRIAALGDIKLRFVPLIFGAIALQLMITTVFPAGSEALHRVAHVLSYGLAAAFLVLNRKVVGMGIIAGGAAVNVIAILANGGVMPASASAERTAGIATDAHDFVNSAAIAHPRLLFLGDILAVPKGWPLSNVYSVGDIVIAIGVIIVIHALCGSRFTARSTNPIRPESPDLVHQVEEPSR